MTHKRILRSSTALAAAAFAMTAAMALSATARAEDAKPAEAAPTAAPAAPAAPPPGYYINGIHLGAQFQGGFYGNASQPPERHQYRPVVHRPVETASCSIRRCSR